MTSANDFFNPNGASCSRNSQCLSDQFAIMSRDVMKLYFDGFYESIHRRRQLLMNNNLRSIHNYRLGIRHVECHTGISAADDHVAGHRVDSHSRIAADDHRRLEYLFLHNIHSRKRTSS